LLLRTFKGLFLGVVRGLLGVGGFLGFGAVRGLLGVGGFLGFGAGLGVFLGVGVLRLNRL
jgi:hypothetical protein